MAHRTGAELIRASQIYAKEDISHTWRLFATTMLALAAAIALTYLAEPWPLKLGGAVLISLINVRVFIFYHDYLHGAIFRKSRAGYACMVMVGTYMLAAPSVWKETHDYHHRNNTKMLGSAVGSYPLVSVRIWNRMPAIQKRLYGAIRHPFTIAAGLLTTFFLGMCVAPFRRNPKQHWAGPVVLIVYLSSLALLGVWLGWSNVFFCVLLPTALHAANGSYLFYVQHNFPDADLKDRKNWDFTYAALNGSSMFDMSPVMHWFTGNIGYHHVHHLNHRIPFYRLPEAMAGMPELQNPGRTSWAFKDIWGCLSVKLWDPKGRNMVSFKQARAILDGQEISAVS